MRLLLVAEQLRRTAPDGISTYVRGLVRGMAQLEADGASGRADLALWASRAPSGQADPVAALGPRVVTSPLPGPALVWAWDRGWPGRWTSPPDGFDVVHASSLAVPPPGPTPMAVTVHDLAWRRVPEAFPPRGRRWHEAALDRALARATTFIVPSRQTADDLIGAGAPPSGVEIVDEGCDHLPAPDLAGAAELRAALGVGENYLLTVSTLEPRKNLARLVAAFQAARPRLPEPWPLLVVGPAGWGEALRPQDGVVLAGPVEGALVAGLYASARVMVSVPLVEGYGLPALEAMACGAPVVASPMPSTGDAAYEVDPLDTAALADALVRVAGDDRVRDELVAAGQARAKGLTWAASAAQHLQVWTSLGSAPSIPPRPA